MARSLKDIKWHDPAHASTAFLTVIVMPLTYSIAYGLLAGIFCWIFLQSLFKIMSLLGIEKPTFAAKTEVDFYAAEDKKKEEGSSDKASGENTDDKGPEEISDPEEGDVKESEIEA